MNASDIAWESKLNGNLIAHLPNGSTITAFHIPDPSGIWGDGYGYIASIPGTKRAVCAKGRLKDLNAVVIDAVERVDAALRRAPRTA